MRQVVGVVTTSLFVALAILLLFGTAYFAQLNAGAYDFTLRITGPVPQQSPTLIVAIDEDSLSRVEAWPWSRDKLARLIERIEADEPRVIAVDVLLDDAAGDEADAQLAAALAASRNIVLSVQIDATGRRTRWRLPNPELVHNHVRLGHAHADPDLDGISRRMFPIKESQGIAFPAFAIQALSGEGPEIRKHFVQTIGAAQVLRPEAFNIRFIGDSRSFEQLPAWQLLEGEDEPGRFKDKIVLIGATAEGLQQDQWFTPFAMSGRKMSGVEIHANAIDTLYAGRQIVAASNLAVLSLLFLTILSLWWLHRRYEGWRFFVPAICLGPVAIAASYVLMKQFGVWLPFPPFLAAACLWTVKQVTDLFSVYGFRMNSGK